MPALRGDFTGRVTFTTVFSWVSVHGTTGGIGTAGEAIASVARVEAGIARAADITVDRAEDRVADITAAADRPEDRAMVTAAADRTMVMAADGRAMVMAVDGRVMAMAAANRAMATVAASTVAATNTRR